MTMIVHGVEIDALPINGVEVETAYVNGVEVFKSSQGIYAENHGGYLISIDKGLVETGVSPTLGAGATVYNFPKSYSFTNSFYFVTVTVSGVYHIEKKDAITGANLGRSPALSEPPQIVIYNSKDGYIYCISRFYASKILASDMATSLMNVAISQLSILTINRVSRLSKDGDYIYIQHDTPNENIYRLRCADLVEDSVFYDGDTPANGRVYAATVGVDGFIYEISNNEFLYKINPSTMTSVNLPDGSTRYGVFLSGQDVTAIEATDTHAFIGYTNGRLRKIRLSDGVIEYTVTTALDGQSGDNLIHIVVDGAYVYCAVTGGGTSASKLIDVRSSSDLSLINTIDLSTTYGNWGVRSLSFRESPYDTLNS